MKPDYSKHAKFARETFVFFPMGLLAIADLCDREGLSTTIFNYPLEQYLNRKWTLAETLKDIDFKICGIDLHWIHNAYGAVETAKIIKEVNPNAKVVLGGFSASYYHDQILKYYKAVDCIVRGEGEIPFLKYTQNILYNRSLDSVPNISYRDTANYIKVNPITYTADTLDDLNFTNISLLNNAKKYFEYSRRIMGIGFIVPMARSCPFNCPFCGGGRQAQLILTGRKKVIFRSPEKVIEDLHNILDNYKVDSIFFGHGIYPATFKYWEKIFELIRKEKFEIGGDLEIWRLPFPKEMWKLFYKTFTHRGSSISISPITMSTKVHQKIANICDPTFNFPPNQIQDLIKNANSFRITLRIFLSTGVPLQTYSDLRNDYIFTIKCLLKYGKSNFQPISIMNEPIYISPGSPAHEEPKKFGIKLKLNSFPEIVYAFQKTKVTYANRVINYDTNHFSRASTRISNLILFLSSAPLFLTSHPKDTEEEKKLRRKFLN